MLRSVNQATKGVAGFSLTSSGVPSCWILPLQLGPIISTVDLQCRWLPPVIRLLQSIRTS